MIFDPHTVTNFELAGRSIRKSENTRGTIWKCVAISTCLFLCAGKFAWGSEAGDRDAQSKVAVKPVVPEASWNKMHIASATPEILKVLSPDAIPFRHRTLIPVSYMKGEEFGFELPDAVWVKTEQTGVVIVSIETDAGIFVKVLEEASPGFASRCRLDPLAFGTLNGKPAEFDPAETRIKGLWILQDAQVGAGETPGWVAVAPAEGKGLRISPESSVQITDLR